MARKKSKQLYYFELYLLAETIEPKHWLQLHRAIIGHQGMLGGTYRVTMRLKDNLVRFFIECDHDLSGLSNALEGVLLRPCPASELELPVATNKDWFTQFVSGGNILDLKEKYHMKKGKSLEYASFYTRALSPNKAVITADLYFVAPGKIWTKTSKMLTSFPANLLAIDFVTNTHYLKTTVPKYLNIEKAVPILSRDNVNALLEIDTFPYFPNNYFLNITSYEFDKHSFIVGASGSGKSKFISLFVDRLQKTALAMNYRVVVIDPHASLAEDFEHIENKKVINFGNESTELFSGTATDISAATELTGTLFKSLMGDVATTKTDRLLRFSLYVLLTAQAMSLGNLKRFLSEVELRNQILQHVEGFVPINIIQFFGADFNEMRTKYYNETISPIVALVDEMQMQPALVGEGELSLSNTIQDNFLTVFSLNKVSMGDKVVKTVAGLLIQQIFLLAQARVFGQRVMLIIDEVSVVQNPALAAILAEARKFNLTVVLTQQYFGQIDKDLRDAIFANTYNYYTFKVSEEDARALEGNMNIELPKELIETEHAKGLDEADVRVKIMTELHPRECLVRVLANGQVIPTVKARTLDAPKSSGHAANPAALKTYKQKPNAMPTKFDEKSAQTESLQPELNQYSWQTPAAGPPQPHSQPPSQPDYSPPGFGSHSGGSGGSSGGSFESAPNFGPSFDILAEAEPTPEVVENTVDIHELHPEDRVSPADIEQAAHFQPNTQPSSAPASPNTPGPMASLGPQTFNLSDLLSHHSSSRYKVRKD